MFADEIIGDGLDLVLDSGRVAKGQRAHDLDDDAMRLFADVVKIILVEVHVGKVRFRKDGYAGFEGPCHEHAEVNGDAHEEAGRHAQYDRRAKCAAPDEQVRVGSLQEQRNVAELLEHAF